MNVLIVHRHESFLERIKEKFVLGGWKVQIATCGLDGLMIARHQPFDLMLCGFDLPGISGTEVVRSTRLLSVNTTTPVFFLRDGSEPEAQVNLAMRLEANTLNETEMEGDGRFACL
jgi:DNA-binding response OmpR family regulator